MVVIQWSSTYLPSIHHLRANPHHEGQREVSVSTAFKSVLYLEDPTVDSISPQRCECSGMAWNVGPTVLECKGKTPKRTNTELRDV